MGFARIPTLSENSDSATKHNIMGLAAQAKPRY
jgi:hypothetical protein